jgi:putative transposase
VIDLFSRAILGWKLSDSLQAEVVTGALQDALGTGLIGKNALFHSDRGCQYSAGATRHLLARHGLRQSMSAAFLLLRQRLCRKPFCFPQSRAT